MTSPSSQLLTHSRLACFRACPRRHYLRYELGIRPEDTGFVLRVGSAFHRALEALDKAEDPEVAISEGLDDPYDLALVAAMFDGHRRRWGESCLVPVASELAFELPLVNPATGAATPIWRVAGVIDRIVEMPDGRIALMEYKTTSRDFAPGADYWLRLHLDPQLSIYVVAARELGYDVQTILYDVTRRPAHRPKKATPPEKRKKKKDGTYYANVRLEDEAPEAFAKRVAESIAADTDKHFARIEIARLDQDLEECRAELWIQQQTIRACQRGGAWYRNPGSCFEPFACDYLAVCQHQDLDTQTPGGFRRVSDVHPELTGSATPGG